MTEHIRPPGKSNVVSAVMAEIARSRTFELVDLKARRPDRPACRGEVRWLISGAMPPRIPDGVDYAATTTAEVAKMLRTLHSVIEARTKLMAGNDGKHLPGQTDVPVVLCIDEGADLLTAPDASDVRATLKHILEQGRRTKVRTAFRSAHDRRRVWQYASPEALEAALERAETEEGA
ncbi:hypothetical protein [Nonomuraea sp. NPDC023979]|uniref:hypothetical protein n=1 Tax=Nonomuraea sp. NPDC023979 TaxID=3154796 RepID=UPI0033EEC1BF